MSRSSDDRGRDPELADLTEILELLRTSGWTYARLRMGDFELELSDGAVSDGPPAPAAAPPAVASSLPGPQPVETPAPSAPEPDAGGVVVRAQSLGVFWRSPQPGAPPFVDVGDPVQPDTPLAIVEVMKMMTRVEPGIAGTVVAIHVENGEVVEFDQPLVTIAPA